MTGSSRTLDAHVHFWDPHRLHYPWLADARELQRTFLPHDLPALAEGVLDGAIFVEANCRSTENLDELAFVEEMAQGGARILGAVAFIDLCDPLGRPALLQRIRRRELVVGVRHNIQHQAAGFSAEREFVRGVQDVGDLGLTFDLCITADQLSEVTELVRQCPDTSFVLDHCGKPHIASDAYEPWAPSLRHLAEYRNVACKLSGLLSQARPDQRSVTGLLPYVRHAMDCFGPDRLMYGSDWPVVTTAGGEPLWRALVHEFTSDWSLAAREAFFFGNALRFYGIRHDVRS